MHDEIRKSLERAGVAAQRLELMAAFLPAAGAGAAALSGPLEKWMRERHPTISTTLFFRPEYGFELLAAAVERLRAQYPGIGCIVMGGGEGMAQAAFRLERAGLADAVLLTGDLDHDVCLAVMARSTLFVRPSYRDGDSVSVREALALGIPVVASDVVSRPGGTIRFKTGDLDGLTAAMRAGILQAGRIAATSDDRSAVSRKLLELYSSCSRA